MKKYKLLFGIPLVLLLSGCDSFVPESSTGADGGEGGCGVSLTNEAEVGSIYIDCSNTETQSETTTTTTTTTPEPAPLAGQHFCPVDIPIVADCSVESQANCTCALP